jgi:hypothetical protein
MARERLTKRLAAAEGAEGNGGDPEKPFPGTVNQPDRKFVERDHYHTFEHTVNHELPDMRHDWQNDQRDEIGFPIPTVASIRAAASKAVKLAVLLLGDKVEENTIEAQARDFMKMGSESLNESLKRFADSENLYKKAEEKEEEKVEAKKAANPIENLGDKKAPPFTKEDAKKAEDKEEVKAKKSEDKEEEKVEAKKAEDKEEEKLEAKKAEDKEEEKVEAKKAEDKEEVKAKKSEDKEEEKVEAKKAAELDIQLTAAEDEEEGEVNAAEEKLLASIFEAEDMEEKKAEDEEEKVEAKKASEKKGVSKLGGQPKVASEGKEIDLSNLWESAPDVSKLFE